MSSSVTSRSGVCPSNVAALMTRFRSVSGPSVADENGSGARGPGGSVTARR